MNFHLNRQWMFAKLLVAGFLSLFAEQLRAQSYAEDRAQIEDLMARYIITMDWRQPEAYANTFTEDGAIVTTRVVTKGRVALAQLIVDLAAAEDAQDKKEDTMEWRPRRRHFVSNITIQVFGDTATSVSYWQAIDNRPDRKHGRVHSFGHYQDKLVKVDGQWLFKERFMSNETFVDRKASYDSPLDFMDSVDD